MQTEPSLRCFKPTTRLLVDIPDDGASTIIQSILRSNNGQTDTVDSHGRTIEQKERAKDIPGSRVRCAWVRTIGRLRSPRRWVWATRFGMRGSMEPKALEDGATFLSRTNGVVLNDETSLARKAQGRG